MNMEFFLLFIWNFMFSILVASSQARKAHLFSPHVLEGPLISSSVALSSSLSPFRSPVFSPEIRPPSISPVSSPVTTPVRQTITPSLATIMNVGEASAGLSASATATGKDYHNKVKKRLLLGVIISLFIAFSLLLCSLFWIYRQKRSKDSDRKSSQCSDVSNGLVLGPILSKFNSTKINGQFLSVIDYSMIENATNNFSDCNIVGEGGSGCVYKACFENNLVAAVKKLDRMQDADTEKEFENEVDLLSKIQHVNVVSLLGFCVHDQRKFLAYEFMQNGSLETQLHGPSHGSMLSWHIRMKIALDTARGLEYLHEHCNPPVIHRDLKSSNILLDSNFNAKISDFGLAIIVGGQRKNNIKLSGTLGYVAPEYLLDGRVTEKSDVYAFGVVLLELLIGRKPVERTAPAQCQSIVTWAMPQLIDRSKLPNIVDPIIKDTMDLKHLYQIAAVAVLCVQPEPSYRPLITDVLHSLIPLVPMELGEH